MRGTRYGAGENGELWPPYKVTQVWKADHFERRFDLKGHKSSTIRKATAKKKKTFQIVCFLTFCHLFFHHLISIHYISLPFQLCIEGLFCGSQLHRSWNLIYQSFPKQKGRVLIDWWMDWLNDWMTNWLRTLRCSENYCSPYPASHFSWKHQKNTRNYAELFKTGDNSRLWGTYRPSFGKPTLLTR